MSKNVTRIVIMSTNGVRFSAMFEPFAPPEAEPAFLTRCLNGTDL